MDINPQWIWIAVVVVAAIIVILVVSAAVRRSRSRQLRDHFGSEYDRQVRAAGSRSAGEQELVNRAEEVRTLDIRPLTAAERERFRDDFKRIEMRFLDRPTTAVVEADELVGEIMRARGYPVADFEQHAARLSVKHPRVVEHYRAGHKAIEAHRSGGEGTEELRQAMLHYRTLVEELVSDSGNDVAREVATHHEIPPSAAAAEAEREARLRDKERAREIRDDERIR